LIDAADTIVVASYWSAGRAWHDANPTVEFRVTLAFKGRYRFRHALEHRIPVRVSRDLAYAFTNDLQRIQLVRYLFFLREVEPGSDEPRAEYEPVETRHVLLPVTDERLAELGRWIDLDAPRIRGAPILMEEDRTLAPPNGGRPCREHPELMGACFKIRGRLNLWSGRPTFRIWEVGTERILGVTQPRFDVARQVNAPDGVIDRFGWGTHMFADFTLCPFTQPEAGYMQLVCIDAAENVDVELDRFLRNR